jgi:16S rRNA (guanine1207-N2)-methyltransferase
MSEHYFSQKPQTKSSPKTWKYQLRDHLYTFTSDSNVFSKGQVDFGSRLLIEAFKAPVTAGDFLDFGCGYGPIGIAVAGSFRNRHVVLADVNERAAALAKENAEKNGLTNVEVVQSDRLSRLQGRQFAAVLTNPPIRAGKNVVHGMFEDAKQILIEHGELWVVIQKKQGAPSAEKKIRELFGNVDVIAKKKGYSILRAVNI